MDDLEFIPIASSSDGNSYILKGGGASSPLLLDAGVPFQKIQESTGFTLSQFAGCLLTHAHGDHAFAIPMLCKHGVPVYASRETIAELKLPLGSPIGLATSKKTFRLKDWTTTAFDAVHDCPGTLAYVIDSPGGHRALFLTDSAYCPHTFAGLTHIFVECNFSEQILLENQAIDRSRKRRTFTTHMSLERLIDMLKSNDLSKVEEIYLLHLSDANSNEETFVHEVRRATGRPTYAVSKRVSA